jgi:hypothetical protein
MNYELAKELYDAGFKPLVSPLIHPSRFARGSHDDQREYIFIPTLAEVITACGEKFRSLSRVYWEEKEKWIADMWANHDERSHIGRGETMEEAVVKLWIALNKK